MIAAIRRPSAEAYQPGARRSHEPEGHERKYSPAECTGARKVRIEDNPDPKAVSTSHVERQNLTMRMHMRRFTRLTNAFLKKVENHQYAVALHFMYYNFARQHQTLRVSPAMAAGLTDRLWGVEAFAERSLDPACTVVSDGLACFKAVTGPGCSHHAIKTGSGLGSAKAPAFKWVTTALGNIKAAITGTYRAISPKHVPRNLAEFEYRFNRRHDLEAMIPRLKWASVRTPTMPYRILKLAEVHA